MYKSALYEEPLLNQLDISKKEKRKIFEKVPKTLRKTNNIDIPNLDETQIIRHFHRLSQMNYGIDSGIYPLGSCTMKYNPKICERIASWSKFKDTHPCQDFLTVQGNLEIMFELERMLCEITGMDYFSLQPAAGAHGEFLGMLITRAYHENKKDFVRDEIILPDTSHGTNPASATMAGFKLIEIPSNKNGTVDLKVLDKTLSEKQLVLCLQIQIL